MIERLREFPIFKWLWQNKAMPLNHYLTVKEVAERLGVGIQRVYDLIDAGRLKVTRNGGRIFVHEDDLKQLKRYKRGGQPKKR